MHLKQFTFKLLLISLILFVLESSADVLYQGWHKVLSAGQHVGYFVLRYELDKKTNKFTYTSFLKTNAVGNDVTEALKAESLQVVKPTQWIVPQKYQYTSTQGKEITLIDATFSVETPKEKLTKKPKNKKSKSEEATDASSMGAKDPKPKLRMQATITKDGKTKETKTFDEILPDNTFLSGFLTYIILQSKDGIKVGNNYKYSAVAEEDAKIYDGMAFIKEAVKENGQDAFKVVNEFKGIRFTSIVTAKGFPLSTKSPLLSIATEATPTRELAIGKLHLDEKNIKTLFGDIPGETTK